MGTYRSNSARPANQTSKFQFPAPEPEQVVERGPAPSFKDKESYQELFKPLPKPDAIPQLVPFTCEVKSYKQLQDEREALMTMQLEKTKCEANELWNRAKTDDQQRLDKNSMDKRRIEEESKAREEILRRGDEERLARDKARKDELRRQEELLTGRKIRSKTTELSVDDIRGGGIQIFHYKDPAVEKIIRNHQKEEIKRRMSHGEVLKFDPNSSNSDIPHDNLDSPLQNGLATPRVVNKFMKRPNGFSNVTNHLTQSSSNSSSTSVNEYKNVMNDKPDYFKASVMVRSQSSSSNTSR